MRERGVTAFSTTAEAACMTTEFLPVTISPSGRAMAAPQYTPLLPFPFASHSAAASRAGSTTLRISSVRPKSVMMS